MLKFKELLKYENEIQLRNICIFAKMQQTYISIVLSLSWFCFSFFFCCIVLYCIV